MATDPARVARAAKKGVTLAVKYGPQAKLAWDNGGRKAAEAAATRAGLVRARRRAFAEAEGLRDGSVLRIAPGGDVVYVVFAGDRPVATHPPRPEGSGPDLAALVADADLDRRTTPAEEAGRRAERRARMRAKVPGVSRRGARPGSADPPGLPHPDR